MKVKVKVKDLVLAIDERTTWMLTNAIFEVYPNLEVLFLSKHSKIDIPFSRYKKNGLSNLIGQLIFIFFQSFFYQAKKNIFLN